MELELTSFLIIERSSEMEGPREAVYSSIIESKRLRFLLLVFLIFAGPNPRAMLDALSETFNTGHRDFVNATYIPALPEISSCASGASGSQLYTHPFPPQACAGNIHWLDNELTMPSSTVQVRIQDCLVPHIERPCIRYCHSCFSYKAITPAPRWAQIPQELRHRLVFVVHDYGTTRLLRVRYFE